MIANLPSVFVYNGSTMPGNHHGVATDITSVFEAVGACALGKITEEELGEIERSACPGEGACGGMFTANTMSSIAEAIGMSLPGTASPPAIDARREHDARMAGEAVVNLLRLSPDEKIQTIIDTRDYETHRFLLFVTREGIVKKTRFTAYDSSRQDGLIAVSRARIPSATRRSMSATGATVGPVRRMSRWLRLVAGSVQDRTVVDQPIRQVEDGCRVWDALRGLGLVASALLYQRA